MNKEEQLVNTKPESLSKCLNKLSLCIERDKLELFHKRKCLRLLQLIRTNQARFKELMLLSNIVESGQYGYLIAVEYVIDDGSFYGQTGDALFYDGTTIRAVECKLVQQTHEIFRVSRKTKVKDQANVCARRIQSWLQHLGYLDNWLSPLSSCEVVGVALTDEETDFLNIYPIKKTRATTTQYSIEFLEEFKYFHE